jgi:hypothetical protein
MKIIVAAAAATIAMSGIAFAGGVSPIYVDESRDDAGNLFVVYGTEYQISAGKAGENGPDGGLTVSPPSPDDGQGMCNGVYGGGLDGGDCPPQG